MRLKQVNLDPWSGLERQRAGLPARAGTWRMLRLRWQRLANKQESQYPNNSRVTAASRQTGIQN
jgi:hypothetical protein